MAQKKRAARMIRAARYIAVIEVLEKWQSHAEKVATFTRVGPSY